MLELWLDFKDSRPIYACKCYAYKKHVLYIDYAFPLWSKITLNNKGLLRGFHINTYCTSTNSKNGTITFKTDARFKEKPLKNTVPTIF